MTKLYKVGLYVRLSKEDFSVPGRTRRTKCDFAEGKITDQTGDSQSIENQIAFLSKIVEMIPGWVEEKVYADDGFSGGSFERPAFKEMMTDVKNGTINLVLVKDLSRFGRNYLEAGEYLEHTLPDMGCRFVSILDNFDTEKGENDLMPIMNAMNDYYLKNLSTRIKTVLIAKAKNGEFLSGYTPYGYKRNPDNHNKLIIDEYAAEVVKRIFDTRMQRVGYAKIAGILNNEGILPPRAYMYQQQGKSSEYKGTTLWHDMTIKHLLKNEVYLGHTIQHTTGTVSYRNKKQIKKCKEDWIRVDNTHPPIIKQSRWDAVQSIDLKKYAPAQRREPEISLFSGLLFCMDCSKTMSPNRETHTRRNGNKVSYISYVCQTHLRTGRVVCSRHCIYEMTLKQIVLDEVQRRAKMLLLDEHKMLGLLKGKMVDGNVEMMAELKSEQKQLERKLHELNQKTARIYEDKVEGIISDKTYGTLITSTEKECLETQERHTALTAEINERLKKMNDIEKWTSLIKEKSVCDTVDRNFLTSLIERIEIGERLVVDGVKQQEVKIYYKFVGLLA